MALRRSGVRIPLGPLAGVTGTSGRSCAIMTKICHIKVTTGVVGHPVSELGERGGSPAKRPTGAHIRKDVLQTELAWPPAREIALVNK